MEVRGLHTESQREIANYFLIVYSPDQRGGNMTKEELSEIIHSMPDGMDVNDYLLEVVNRALFIERKAIAQKVLDYTENWDRIHRETALDVVEIVRERK